MWQHCSFTCRTMFLLTLYHHGDGFVNSIIQQNLNLTPVPVYSNLTRGKTLLDITASRSVIWAAVLSNHDNRRWSPQLGSDSCYCQYACSTQHGTTLKDISMHQPKYDIMVETFINETEHRLRKLNVLHHFKSFKLTYSVYPTVHNAILTDLATVGTSDSALLTLCTL